MRRIGSFSIRQRERCSIINREPSFVALAVPSSCKNGFAGSKMGHIRLVGIGPRVRSYEASSPQAVVVTISMAMRL